MKKGRILMVKCVIYSRVSTEEQSTANQINILTEWAETRGFTVVEVYQEQESAWRNGHQRELARFSRHAHRARFSIKLYHHGFGFSISFEHLKTYLSLFSC